MTLPAAAPPALFRSLLSVPAINGRAMGKIASLACDGVILDLEDSVPAERKAEARAAMAGFLGAGRPDGKLVLVRLNDVASPHFADDVAALAGLKPDGVLLPKVNDPRDLGAALDQLSEAGAEIDHLWAMMETPKAFLNVANLCEAARAFRLSGLVAGLNDLRKATGIRALPGRAHLVGYLAQMVLAGRAYGLTVIDSVSNDFADLDAFRAECDAGADMGFDGKMLIHPAQIGPANAAFSPRPEDLDEARAIIAAFAAPEAEGQGAIRIGGTMVERLHLDDALRLVARHDHIMTRRTDP